MRYVKVTIIHQPDAGQYSNSHLAYPEVLGQTDATTAGEFAFKALDDGTLVKGRIKVAFPEGASYSFQFGRMGLVGYNLTEAQDQPVEVQLM